jgi:hypothetical protein
MFMFYKNPQSSRGNACRTGKHINERVLAP